MNLTTTLALIREHSPCASGYAKLLRTLGKDYPADKPIPFSVILASNGLDDALWGLRAVADTDTANRDRLARLFSAECADAVLHLFEAKCPDDMRPRQAIAAARAFARGEITDAARAAAGAAAGAAARAAARNAAGDAEWAAALDAAGAAAWAAAWAASLDAAGASAGDAARNAAGDAAWAAAWAAATEKQAAKLLDLMRAA